MRKHLYVDNTDLATFGVYISGGGTFGSPAKDIDIYPVPGRNGVLLGPTPRLENIEVTYPCFIYKNFAQNMKNLRSFLLSRDGYVKINDDYDTDHFRQGFFISAIEPTMTPMLEAGSFDLTFNCKPQRWLNSGETVIEGIASITNPYQFIAKPLLEIYGYGTIYFNPPGELLNTKRVDLTIDQTLYDLSSSITYVVLDCENMTAYTPEYPSANAYQYITTKRNNTLGVDFPILAPGYNTIYTYNSHFTNMKMTPRWWEV